MWRVVRVGLGGVLVGEMWWRVRREEERVVERRMGWRGWKVSVVGGDWGWR